MFLLYRTEPSARKVEVVDCNFITVPLILAITAAYFILSQSRNRNPVIPAPNTELKMLPPHSPFPNIVEQAISCLKAAIKANISRSETQNAWITEMRPEPEESHWGSFEHNCSRLCTETSTL